MSRQIDARPTWEIAELWPAQGDWSIHDLIALPTNRLVELSRGVLSILPHPSDTHQGLLAEVADQLKAAVGPRGKAIVAPFPVRVGRRSVRMPDVVALLDRDDARRGNRYWSGADIVVEIVSREDPDLDYYKKRRDYARAGIPEYWIVDPKRRLVRQFALDGERYRTVGTFRAGDLPASRVLDGWTFDVAACMKLADDAPPDEPPAARD
jgi:Uma2 family endonuclease